MTNRLVVEMPECLLDHCNFLAQGLSALAADEARLTGDAPRVWSADDVVTFLVEQYFHPCEGCLDMAEEALARAGEEGEEQDVPALA